MVTHWETRELPVYGLVLATPGKLGPKLKPHTGDCNRPLPQRRLRPARARQLRYAREHGRHRRKGDRLGITMATFARNLSGGTGRYVIDQTGLEGAFDLELEFTPDQSPDTTGSSFFTAIQEQLGLKLDSHRAPVEVIVIDRVERPLPD